MFKPPAVAAIKAMAEAAGTVVARATTTTTNINTSTSIKSAAADDITGVVDDSIEVVENITGAVENITGAVENITGAVDDIGEEATENITNIVVMVESILATNIDTDSAIDMACFAIATDDPITSGGATGILAQVFYATHIT